MTAKKPKTTTDLTGLLHYEYPVCRLCYFFVDVFPQKRNGKTLVLCRAGCGTLPVERLMCGTRAGNRRACEQYVAKSQIIDEAVRKILARSRKKGTIQGDFKCIKKGRHLFKSRYHFNHAYFLQQLVHVYICFSC